MNGLFVGISMIILGGMVIVLFVPLTAYAHSGGLNSEGCHNNRTTGGYHCHFAPSSPVPAVKKSNSGICHARGSTYYSRTWNYEIFNDIKACLDSGGRMPKR